jgi:hypothetical protein
MKRTVRTWLRLGGRMVDCAQNYLNEVSQTVQSEKGNEQSIDHCCPSDARRLFAIACRTHTLVTSSNPNCY